VVFPLHLEKYRGPQSVNKLIVLGECGKPFEHMMENNYKVTLGKGNTALEKSWEARGEQL
jgi:hypothetical protein